MWGSVAVITAPVHHVGFFIMEKDGHRYILGQPRWPLGWNQFGKYHWFQPQVLHPLPECQLREALALAQLTERKWMTTASGIEHHGHLSKPAFHKTSVPANLFSATWPF
jgi:hypothetical protein